MTAINHKSILRLVSVLAFIILVSLGITQPALSFEEDSGGYIPADQVINDDLMIAAETVIIDGTVNGDVIASGGTVVINGTVNGNVAVNGGRIELNGPIHGSVASTAQQLIINSSIDGSLYFAGVELTLNPTAQIERNILVAAFSAHTLPGSSVGTDIHGTAYQVVIEGSVGRDVFIDGMAVEISGEIGGDADFHVGNPHKTAPNMSWLELWLASWGLGEMPDKLAPGLRISPEAKITGQLKYKSSAEQSDTILTEPGNGVTFMQISSVGHERTPIQLWLMARLRELLTLLALGALAIWLVPNAVKSSSLILKTKPLLSLGWGILGLIIGYTAILVTAILLALLGVLLAIVTLGGLAGAVAGIGFSGLIMVAGIFTLLVIYGSKLVFAYLFGDWIVSRLSPEGTNLRFVAQVVGITLYMVLRLIPIVSVIVGIIATLFGLGAMVLAFKNCKKEKVVATVLEQSEAISEQ